MIRKPFVNRKNELSSLKNHHAREGFEFIVITGRRRVGKTRLLQEFSKGKKCIFLMCEERKWRYNLDKFNRIIGDFFNIPTPNFKSFRDCFEYIANDEKTIVIIDEFSYLMKNKDIIGEFQGIVDEILSDKDHTLILSGSAVSMMKKSVLSQRSPLYGRTTAQLNLRPLKFSHLSEWFQGVDMEDIIKIFGVADSIPKYLEFFKGKNVNSEIKQNLFSPDAFLFREAKMLLEEELREPETYYQILEAISFGHTRTTDIANHSYMEAKNVSSYLNILEDLGFVEKEISILDSRRKRGLYKIKDNYFKFWFRFVSPYFTEIENWQGQGAINEFNRSFDRYLGSVFEDVCRELLRTSGRWHKLGRWWYKEDEIDIVGLNEREDTILFGECKWSKKKVGLNLLDELKEKSVKVRWKNETRKEVFYLFSRSGFTQELISHSEKGDNLNLFSPKDSPMTMMEF
ncbi:MAG: ATP-binding protein [Thermoplasmata archaeon]